MGHQLDSDRVGEAARDEAARLLYALFVVSLYLVSSEVSSEVSTELVLSWYWAGTGLELS